LVAPTGESIVFRKLHLCLLVLVVASTTALLFVAEPRAGSVKTPPKTATVDLGGGVKMEFVLIPRGKFQMGSPEDEKDRADDEEQHEVVITRPFYLGKYEVTQEQYGQIVGANPSWFSADGEGKESVKDLDTRRFPVEQVSWEDAVSFCRKLTDRDDKRRRFRLPSEAEWEYACRAGTTTPFHFGKALNGDKANCAGNVPYGTDEKGRYLERTCRVGSYAANAFGLYDMHGNVWEWCEDYYGPYKGLDIKDQLRTEKVDESARVVRGGSWYSSARHCRAAVRGRDAPGNRDNSSGFRVAFLLD
jgi:formylglycine-generating enzyme required for sulfatase activity